MAGLIRRNGDWHRLMRLMESGTCGETFQICLLRGLFLTPYMDRNGILISLVLKQIYLQLNDRLWSAAIGPVSDGILGLILPHRLQR